MNGILEAIVFLVVLIIVVIAVMYFALKKNDNATQSSRYILNKFKPDNAVSELTEMIEFHRDNDMKSLTPEMINRLNALEGKYVYRQ